MTVHFNPCTRLRGGNTDEVTVFLQRTRSDELRAPVVHRHRLLKQAVTRGNTSRYIRDRHTAVNGYLLAVLSHDVRTGETLAFLGNQIVSLALIERDLMGCAAKPAIEGISIRRDINRGVVFRSKNSGQTHSVIEVTLHLGPVVLRVILASERTQWQDVTCIHGVE